LHQPIKIILIMTSKIIEKNWQPHHACEFE